MSIIIIGLDRTGAIIATDTQLCGADSYVGIAKLFPIPHIAAILAGRGMARLTGMMAVEIATRGLDFDAAAELLPKLIVQATADLADHISRLHPRSRRNELFLVGWSRTRHFPMAHHYAQEECQGAVAHQIFEPDEHAGRVLCAPWIEDMGPTPTLADLATNGGIMAVARRQCGLMNRRWAPRSAGGEIICAQIFEGGMVCRSIGTIGAEG